MVGSDLKPGYVDAILQARKDKETDSLLEPPERNSALL